MFIVKKFWTQIAPILTNNLWKLVQFVSLFIVMKFTIYPI